MIRIVSIAALLCLLVLVLYLPSAHPPERFLAQIRSEHQAMEALWGEAPALRILDRALGLQGVAREATPVPPTTTASHRARMRCRCTITYLVLASSTRAWLAPRQAARAFS